MNSSSALTHWGRVTHICVGKLTIIGSDNGLSPEGRQAIIWTNAGILLIGPLGTNFSEILIKIQTFSSKKIRLKMSSAKCCSFRAGLNVLNRSTSIAVYQLPYLPLPFNWLVIQTLSCNTYIDNVLKWIPQPTVAGYECCILVGWHC